MTYRYPTIKIDGKTKLKHRHIAEQQAGRPLRSDEHVHHVDRDAWNFAAGNLEVKPGLQHLREHAEERRVYPRTKACVICGQVFAPHPTKRKRQKTCSPACANELRSRTERATKSPIAAALVSANCNDLAVANREAAE